MVAAAAPEEPAPAMEGAPAGAPAAPGGGGKAACRRLCGLTPFLSLGLIAMISYSTLYSGWMHPIGLRERGWKELVFFAVELVMLLWSYLSAVLWGPTFVPPGWTPTAAEIEAHLGSPANRPLDAPPPARDVLQYCAHCEGYKPPRAHHCSECKRCVLWMDHHCPWTGTCVGHQNMQAFVLFVHYVPIACLHSFIIHVEIPIKLFIFWYSGRTRAFWYFLYHLQAIVALTMGISALAVMLLVGSLAWNLRWSVNNNMTMVEEMVMEKAEARRVDHREAPFSFPYDLGCERNWDEMFGSTWRSRVIPQRQTSEAYWPAIRKGAGHFDLSVEQLVQKARKLTGSYVVQVAKRFDAGLGRWSLPYFCGVAREHGCGAVCCCPVACTETRISMEKDDWVLMGRREGSWSQISHLRDGPEDVPEDSRGWVPHSCFVAGEYKRYELPDQRFVQGLWEGPAPAAASPSASPSGSEAAPAVRKIRISGVLVQVLGSREAYALRSEGPDNRLSLLGVQLLELDGKKLRWANGDVWCRPVLEPGPSPTSPGSSTLRQRRFGAPQEDGTAEDGKGDKRS